ncbi:PspC domain-containing protein [Gordonia humi]|uniref:Phage shock protein PspC (Stress-responsive transcriptional regulator) n=1 Tax=Gordonia humi TaxID=686429 RepID=A0A840EZU3_9ACTN|nr:PspC domain-containing protein [Gordonia humi]MBB4137152.1 phage shock protein PspC (stress-responsive transcriptional regulator) [Gordonia humi]
MSDQIPPYTPDPTVPAQPRRLRRSRTDRKIAGIAGGVADYLGVDSTRVRVAFVASILLPGPQVLLYLILWLVIPED